MADNGCQKVYVKTLSANDNSKNQVYIGGSFNVINIFPFSAIQAVPPGTNKRERFKALINFSWIGDDGMISPAPGSQFILYPDYPEVRFSGFLTRCLNAPRDLMRSRIPGRLLFLAVTDKGQTIGFVTAPNSTLATEFENTKTESSGIFRILEVTASNGREKLIYELNRIHQLDWIKSKRLNKSGSIIKCEAPQCGGYTLEAELGITPNGYSEPDFLGWEIKQFGVTNFNKLDSATITLMTPEPTGGFYGLQGGGDFIRKYGYPDKSNIPDRINFGGVHKAHVKHKTTLLTMELIGFDGATGKIINPTGRIALVDQYGNEAATWPFDSMLEHWNRKHNQACYVPSQISEIPYKQYRYGKFVKIGIGTDFQFFLQQMFLGNIRYDPGLKIENASTNPTVKLRNQFRIKSGLLNMLYKKNEIVDVTIP